MRYEAPTTIADAVALLDNQGLRVQVMAGGTDLIVRMRSGVTTPDLIVDIKRIPELGTIGHEESGWRIGATVSAAEVCEHNGLRADWPGVVEAIGLIGSTQVQGRATAAGNLCNGSPAADSVPAMVAAGAHVRVVGPGGSRDLPITDIPLAPGRTALGPADLVTAILLPQPVANSADAYLRFIPRSEMDIAVVGAAVRVTLDRDGICVGARVALGAVAPTVLDVNEAAGMLTGTAIDDGALIRLAEACSAACRPIDDKRGTVTFRRHVAGVIARRAAIIARDRVRAGVPR